MAIDWPNWAVFSKNTVNSYQLQINYPPQRGTWQVFGRREIDRNLVRTTEEKLSLGRDGRIILKWILKIGMNKLKLLGSGYRQVMGSCEQVINHWIP
jgi:hypothetical protein